MVLSAAIKDYIARELGIGDCFVYSGLSWTAVSVSGETVSETGGTGKLLSRIISGAIDHVDVTSPITKTFRASDLPGTVTLADVMNSVLTEDNNPVSETQYCATGALPPPPTPPVTPPLPPPPTPPPPPPPPVTPPADIYKHVKIVPPAGTSYAYVSDIQIPSEMTIGITYSGAVIVSVTTPGQYKAELHLRALPINWDGNIATLPGVSSTITTETKQLNTGSHGLNWSWAVPDIPGDFVIVSLLYIG